MRANPTHLTLTAAVLLLAPMAYAHTDGNPPGTPKLYCEDVAGDQDTHDYGPPATGLFIAFGLDASTPPCPYDPQWDGHFEWAVGGAWLLACETSCGEEGVGGGVDLCWDTIVDHEEFPEVAVFDNALSSMGIPVTFSVHADRVNNAPALDPAQPDCGDFESDVGALCIDFCSVGFRAGLDGSYQVYVCGGTSGHVFTLGGGSGGSGTREAVCRDVST